MIYLRLINLKKNNPNLGDFKEEEHSISVEGQNDLEEERTNLDLVEEHQTEVLL